MNNEHYINNMDDELRKQVQDRRRMLHENCPENCPEQCPAKLAENVTKQDERKTLQETQLPDELRNSSEIPKKTHKFGTCLLIFTTILLSSLMIYVGVQYSYCEDRFSPWLITGGVLSMVDVLFLLLALKTRNACCCHETFARIAYGISFAIFFWWVFGFSRIFSGGIFKEQIHMENDLVCKWYLFWIPLSLTLLPFLIFAVVFYVLCYKDGCCENKEDVNYENVRIMRVNLLRQEISDKG